MSAILKAAGGLETHFKTFWSHLRSLDNLTNVEEKFLTRNPGNFLSYDDHGRLTCALIN